MKGSIWKRTLCSSSRGSVSLLELILFGHDKELLEHLQRRQRFQGTNECQKSKPGISMVVF